MKVAAVVPAFNEEKTMANVLKVLASHNKISKIIVVDDGSTDNTPNIIRQFKVKVITLKKNSGKGEAVKIATEKIQSDAILFIDADLIGLKKWHITKLLDPVISEDAAMTIGLRDKGNWITNNIMPHFPLTGGERAILTNVFVEIRKNPLIGGWGLESVMNHYCKKKKLKIVKVKLSGLDHIGMQTRKYGWIAFLKEIYEVALAKIKLLAVNYP